MTPSKQELRRFWFQVHKWLGLALAILVVPICLTGSALVWDEALDGALHPQRAATIRPLLGPSDYASAARRLGGNDKKLASLAFPAGAGPVIASLVAPALSPGARPARSTLWLAPDDARLLDRTDGDSGLFRTIHIIHGTLMVPGVGRQIVGSIGVAMLISSISGLWLWCR